MNNSIYNDLLVGLKQFRSRFEYTNISPDSVVNIYRKVLADHPEIFWASNGCKWTNRTSGAQNTIVFEPSIHGNSSNNTEKVKKLESIVLAVLSNLNDIIDEWTKALIIHDWIVNNAEYDRTVESLSDEQIIALKKRDSFNAYGALVLQNAVCSGYSSAFQLLAKRAQMECRRVSGTGRRGPHEWNIIKINGKHYHVDVTWDDPVFEGNKKSVCRHDYFCVSTQEILRTHSIDNDQDIPFCSDADNSFYHHKGTYFRTYHFPDVAAIISLNADSKYVELKFGSPTEVQNAIADMIKGQRFYYIPGIEGKYTRLSYSIGSTNLTLSLEWT